MEEALQIISDKELESRIYKELLQFSKQIKNGQNI
jgi:hypothetical protein